MAGANNERVSGTGKSAIGLVIIGILVVAVIGVAVWYALTHPDFMQNVWNIVLLVVGVILIIAAILAIAVFVFAVPLYAFKGERYQEDVDYDIDDVKSVGEKNDKEGGAR